MGTSANTALIYDYKFIPKSTKNQDANGANVTIVKDGIEKTVPVRRKSIRNFVNIVKI